MSTDLQTVLQKMEQAASGTYSQSNRAILGEEINAILEQFIGLANTKSMGRCLFSGAKTDTTPYTTQADGGYITEVRYQGSLEALPVPIAPGMEMTGALVGEEVFRSQDRQEPQFLGSTGAAAGAGTSTVRGDLSVRLEHEQTIILADPDGVNLASGSGPGHSDTILGERDLIVDFTAKTIRFADGGPLSSFGGTEEALAVRSADGDVVYVDVTALNGALVGPHTVTIRAEGSISIDGGPSTALSDFTDGNLAVPDAGGRILYVDTTGIRRIGLEPVRVGGTFDLFDTLIRARDILLRRIDLSDEEQMEMLGLSVEAVNEIVVDITQTMTSVGARLGALETLKSRMADIRAVADDQAGTLENADLVQVAADLARAQTLYQMTLATASKLLTLSLLDFI
jgi:flagellin-like hook-associated protein FlgL